MLRLLLLLALVVVRDKFRYYQIQGVQIINEWKFLIIWNQVEGSPEWQAYKNAELAFIAPSVGPAPVNYAQAQLNHVGPAPGPTPAVNFAQAQLNYQQEALNFIASGAGR